MKKMIGFVLCLAVLWGCSKDEVDVAEIEAALQAKMEAKKAEVAKAVVGTWKYNRAATDMEFKNLITLVDPEFPDIPVTSVCTLKITGAPTLYTKQNGFGTFGYRYCDFDYFASSPYMIITMTSIGSIPLTPVSWYERAKLVYYDDETLVFELYYQSDLMPHGYSEFKRIQ